MTLRPLNKKVLIRPDQKRGAHVRASGIHLLEDPDQKRDGVVFGTVLNPGKSEDVKEGDRVLFGKYSGIVFKTTSDDEELLLVENMDIMAVIEGEEAKGGSDGEKEETEVAV